MQKSAGHKVFFILLFFCAVTNVHAQGISTEGRDFHFGFMQNWLQSQNNPIILEVYISAVDSTMGRLEMPGVTGFAPIDFFVAPNTTYKIELPSQTAMNTGSESIQNKAIHIETDNIVSVYAMNKRQYSADMTVILPTASLGNEYYVMAHWEEGTRNNGDNSYSEFLIVSIADSTQVLITPSVTTQNGKPAGVPFEIILQKNETYQVKSRGDLTGTKVIGINKGGCQPLALFAGNEYTKVGQCNHPDGHDHLFSQMYPVSTWGRNFVFADFETRTGGDMVKILAAEDQTTVDVGGTQYQLNSGEYVKVLLAGVRIITSDRPVAVGHLSRSQGCDNTVGDPFLIMLSPNEQLLSKITFNAPTIATLSRYNVTVITKTDGLDGLTFDGASISDRFNAVPDNPAYSYAYLTTGYGNHTLTSMHGFIAYVYAYGNNESFGYSAGASLGNLALALKITNPNLMELPWDSVCHKSDVLFIPKADTTFTSFEYEFGDGSVLMAYDTLPVTHVYDNPGDYIVTLTARRNLTNCLEGGEETTKKQIRVVDPQVSVFGPGSVCPNTPDVPYHVLTNYDYSYSWSANGGALNTSTGDSVLVSWGVTNPGAEISVVAINKLGCAGDTLRKFVQIKVQLEPEAPFGPDTLCSAEIMGKAYFTHDVPGTSYQWEVTGGKVTAGQGGPGVTVDWDSYGLGQLWFYQLTETDTVCSGTSDTTMIYIQRNPSDKANIKLAGDTLLIGQGFEFTLEADTLLPFANWAIDGTLHRDTVASGGYYSHVFNCQGLYDLSAVAFDTLGVCPVRAESIRQLTVLPPEYIIEKVSNIPGQSGQLELLWTAQKDEYYDKPVFLERMDNWSPTWKQVMELNRSYPHVIDQDIYTDSLVYTYRIITNADCPVQISALPHNSILLKAGKNEEDDSAVMDWNNYINWPEGVENYEVWMSTDGGERVQLTEGNLFDYQYLNDSTGFDHCFVVRARRAGQPEIFSWSNEACVEFVPPVHTYNVITPNGDSFNEFFRVIGIENYPQNLMTIYNRWGQTVYEKSGYLDEWQGQGRSGQVNPGTYYFVLDLKDSRAGEQVIKGWVEVVY